MSTPARLIQSVLSEAQQTLAQALQLDHREAKFEARLLLETALHVNHAWLLAHENEAMDAKAHAQFQSLIERRASGEPVAYILGQREFFGLTLKVTKDTLIPRPDTETLVEAALTKIPSNATYSILDLGTGTGAIALAIAKNRPLSIVTAVDVSIDALKVAQENAQILNIKNVRFILSDWFSELNGEQFDVIVSNPPYIESQDEHLKLGDLRFEPLSALASGEDGLDDIRRIIQAARQYLKQDGWLILEHGYNQAISVSNLFKLRGVSKVDNAKDLSGITRITFGQLA